MCFRASVLLRKASALKRIDVRYGPQNAFTTGTVSVTLNEPETESYIALINTTYTSFRE